MLLSGRQDWANFRLLNGFYIGQLFENYRSRASFSATFSMAVYLINLIKMCSVTYFFHKPIWSPWSQCRHSFVVCAYVTLGTWGLFLHSTATEVNPRESFNWAKINLCIYLSTPPQKKSKEQTIKKEIIKSITIKINWKQKKHFFFLFAMCLYILFNSSFAKIQLASLHSTQTHCILYFTMLCSH
jgi:hypothetical protein